MVERVLCMHEAPGSMPESSIFFFFFKIVLVGLRSCSRIIVTGSESVSFSFISLQ